MTAPASLFVQGESSCASPLSESGDLVEAKQSVTITG
jgi:hypothetical protein